MAISRLVWRAVGRQCVLDQQRIHRVGAITLCGRSSHGSASRFAAADWHYDHGLPRLSGSPAWLVCELAQAVRGGDHMLLLGTVCHADTRTAPPLVYGHRAYGTHSGFASRPRRPVTDLIAACSH